jgi:ABC-type antimicrobial peptide transport system permease subunit
VAILDETLAREVWPQGDALGQRVVFASGEQGRGLPDASYEVVGIVGSTRRQLFEKELPGAVYVPFAQAPQATYFHVRPANSSIDLVDEVRREVRDAAPGLPLFAVRTFENHISESIGYWALGLTASLFAAFGGAAMLVAVVGIHGVTSYSVSRRTREIGLRMALGAMPGTVRQMILAESLWMTALGLGTGWVMGIGVGRLLSSIFVDLRGFDVATFTVVPAGFLLTALVAAWLPARRATQVDPMAALKSE